MEYRIGSHTKYKIEYHFVWATKYHYHVLTDEVAARVRELVRQTCERFENHILVSAPSNISPSDIMRRVKERVSRKIFEDFPHLKKRYWGRHFWSRGYFCITSGELTKEMIKNIWSIILTRTPIINLKLNNKPA